MALSKQLETAINEQLNAEFYSSYLYLSMACHLTQRNMPGCARWMDLQSQEEMQHAVKLKDFILDRQGTVRLAAIDAPPSSWESVQDTFEKAYAHEKEITERIHKLVALAASAKDHATENMMRWFVDEQVEEEATLDEIINKFRLVGESGSGLFMIDRELGSRTSAATPA